jgi:hypothetical protein
MANEIFAIDYQFKLNNGLQKHFSVRLMSPSFQLIRKKIHSYPAWTKLEYEQCPVCPLNSAEHPHCPIAVNLIEVINFFKDYVSSDEVEIIISTKVREFHKFTSLQEGLSSIIGIYMVSSGCPILDKLRPMVFTHLPFATPEETMYRAASMYLLAQYFLQKRGKRAEWELKGLVEIYGNVNKVNHHFHKRLLSINPKDASLNALFHLNCFAALTTMSIADDCLEELESLFQAYLCESA